MAQQTARRRVPRCSNPKNAGGNTAYTHTIFWHAMRIPVGACNPHDKQHLKGAARVNRSMSDFQKDTNRRLTPSERAHLLDQFPTTAYRWKTLKALSKLTHWIHSPHTKCKQLKRLKTQRDKKAEGKPGPLSLTKDKNIIYAMYHTSCPDRLYVGQTIKDGYTRFKEHVNHIRNAFHNKKGKDGKDAHGITPFHKHMTRLGWKGLRLFPLEQICGGNMRGTSREEVRRFRSIAEPREKFWKQHLHAFAPRGYTVEHKQYHRSFLRTHQTELRAQLVYPNTSARFEKKIRYLFTQIESGRFHRPDPNTNGLQNTILYGHSTKNLKKIYRILEHSSPNEWEVGMNTFNTLLQALPTPNADNSDVTTLPLTHVIQLFTHREIGDLGTSKIIADEEMWRDFMPESVRKLIEIPMLSYKYAEPISRTLCNYGEVSAMSASQVQKVLNTECACHKYQDYIHHDTGHVLTSDPTILGNDKLRSFMERGTKFRFEVHPALKATPPGTNITPIIKQDVARALETWKKQVSVRFGRGVSISTLPWIMEVMKKVNANNTPLTIPPISESSLTRTDLAQLHEMHKHFTITTIDKAASNFIVQCKKDYLNTCLKELNEGVAYTVSERTPEEILLEGNEFCKSVGLRTQRKAKLPNIHARTKMHKSPIGHRIVAGSPAAPLTPVSLALNEVFKGIMPHIKEIWDKTALKIPGITTAHLSNRTGFIIDNTPRAAEFVASHRRPRAQRRNKLHLSTYDFCTMYTCLPHEDLISRLNELLTQVWRDNKVTDDADHTALFLKHDGTHFWQDVHCTDLPMFRKRFSLTQCTDMLTTLVRNTYVKFAGEVFHQVVGIPMGTNCAGFLANLYCFSYELEHLTRLVEAKDFHRATDVVTKIVRYIDDLLTIDFKDFQEHIYLPNGIYPRERLELQKTGEGFDVDYMDLYIKQNRKQGLYTMIYDKRLDEKFEKIQVIRYPHRLSALSDHSKYGIVNSQMFRASQLCTLPVDFCYNVALVMHRMIITKEYNPHKVRRRVRVFLSKHHGIYGKSSQSLYSLISSLFDKLVIGTIKPGPKGKVVPLPHFGRQ
jgi:hypothetical protein